MEYEQSLLVQIEENKKHPEGKSLVDIIKPYNILYYLIISKIEQLINNETKTHNKGIEEVCKGELQT